MAVQLQLGREKNRGIVLYKKDNKAISGKYVIGGKQFPEYIRKREKEKLFGSFKLRSEILRTHLPSSPFPSPISRSFQPQDLAHLLLCGPVPNRNSGLGTSGIAY